MNNEIRLKVQAIPFAAFSECMTEQIPYEHIKSLITKKEPYKVYISVIRKDENNIYVDIKTKENINNATASNSYLVNGLMRNEATFVIRYYLAYIHNLKYGIVKEEYDDKIDMSMKLDDMNIILVFDDEAYKIYKREFIH